MAKKIKPKSQVKREPDAAQEWTDEYLEEVEEELRAMYTHAQEEITREWDAYLAAAAIALGALWLAYQKAAGDEKKQALREYQQAEQEYHRRNSEYQRLVDETAYRLLNVNRLAMEYINGSLPRVYLENYNQPIDGLDILPNLSFPIMPEDMLENLIRDGQVHLPDRSIDPAKDVAWNIRQIENAVLQGILQGEDVWQIANRIRRIVDINRNAALRMARTMVTGAQNRGRLDRYNQLAAQGLILHKVWMATPDGRTRDWHLDMDGQERELDAPFIDGLGNELMYPADPSGPPETVYNCRCTMYSEMVGVRRADGSIRYVSGHYGTSALHEEQMARERARRAQKDG